MSHLQSLWSLLLPLFLGVVNIHPTTSDHHHPRHHYHYHYHDAPTAKKPRLASTPLAIVLDIEGTVAPISYVAETLFPYAAKHVERHLRATFDQAATQRAVQALRALGVTDAAEGRADAVAVPEDVAGQEVVIEACLKSVQRQMASDRKTTALKLLQARVVVVLRVCTACLVVVRVLLLLCAFISLTNAPLLTNAGSGLAQRFCTR